MSAQPKKQAVRDAMLARRLALSGAERKASALAVAEHLIASDAFAGAVSVAGYVAARGELDPLFILEYAAGQGIPTALPFLKGGALEFAAWKPGEKLQEGAYKIPAPAAEIPVIPALVLVPLLAFDALGHRLGSGRGYYDRALAAPDYADTQRIGLAYRWQRAPDLPSEPHDVTLHAVVTEDGIEWFK